MIITIARKCGCDADSIGRAVAEKYHLHFMDREAIAAGAKEAGSFVAFIIALLGGNVVVQGIAFILVSVVLLALTKPWAGKYINSRTVKTNVDSLVGERAVLTEDADSMKQTGKAVVNGQEWTVRPQDETQVIRKGELIEVVKISGVKLIVKRVKEA